jgi:hypothetical protein
MLGDPGWSRERASFTLVLESEALAVDADDDEWCRIRASIAAVRTVSPAKAVSQLPKVRFEVRIIEPRS